MEDFKNRLRKMQRHFGKWARRSGITCYRVYDADIPEHALAVDHYEGLDGILRVHVAEYLRGKVEALPEDERRLRRFRYREIIAEVMEVEPERIFYKHRERQSGKQQYTKMAEAERIFRVEEDGLKFWVNLSDYLDTGLFLDHRITRGMVREAAMGKKLLNLFAYTGSFTVYGAAGGATGSLTVDLSNTYLEWAERNLAENDLAGPEHRFLRTDVKDWLRDEEPDETFDIIVLDPPTFSNSKSMRFVLDVQDDHPFLINRCLRRLNPGGKLFFSTNFRKFQFTEERIYGKALVSEITNQTIPPDFRNRPPHRCWLIELPQ
jgi:23S rRNA G2069 N7-methylase RlmK/C1962 C5-methylase RlmI